MIKRLPFEAKRPNQETLHVFRDSDEGKNRVMTHNLEALYSQLGI